MFCHKNNSKDIKREDNGPKYFKATTEKHVKQKFLPESNFLFI